MPVSWEDFGVSLVFNVGVCLLCILVFSVLRKLPVLHDFYNGKRMLSIPFRFRPPMISPGLFSWVPAVLRVSDAQFAASAGFDALTYVHFLRLCVVFSAFVSLLVLAVLLPTNWVGGDFVEEQLAQQGTSGEECSSTSGSGTEAAQGAASGQGGSGGGQCSGLIVTDFDKTSLTNINEESLLMFVHLGAIYIITLVLLKLLWSFYKDTVRWRMLYLAWLNKGDVAHTVYVHDIPQKSLLGRLAAKAKPASSKVKLPAKDPFFKDPVHDVYKYAVDEAPKESPGGDGGEPADVNVNVSQRPTQRHIMKGAIPLSGSQSYAADGDSNGHVREPHDAAHWALRPAGTDFETKEQAASALADGVSMRELVAREFTRTFGAAELEHVAIVHDDKKLRSLYKKYNKKKASLEKLQDKWAAKLRKRKPVNRKTKTVRSSGSESKAAWFGQGKNKTGDMEYMMWELDDLLREIRGKQSEVSKTESNAAFVTMRSRLAQSIAATGALSYDETKWVTEAAPQPESIIWNNVAIDSSTRGVRRAISWGLFVLMIVFFIPVVAAIQSLVNLAAYSNNSAVETIMDLPIVSGLINSVLPTIVFKLFLILVPILLTIGAKKLTGQPSLAAVDREVAIKAFIFFYIVIFVFNTVIGLIAGGVNGGGNDNAIVGLVDYIGDNGVTEVIELLGTALPQQAAFFMFFILVDALFGGSIKFLRISGAAIYFILSKMSASWRQKKQLFSQNWWMYGKNLPGVTITFLLMLTFAVVQPFLPLIALAYFSVSYLYARYDLLYTNRESYQSGGLIWPVIFEQVMVGIFTFLLSNLALLGVKKFQYAALVIPLIVIVVIFRIRVGNLFGRPMQVLPAHAAADLDRNDKVYDWYRDVSPEEVAEMRRQKWDIENMRLGPVEGRYVQETMLVDDEEHRDLMNEGWDIIRRVDAFNAGDSMVLDEVFMKGGGPPEGDYKPHLAGVGDVGALRAAAGTEYV